MSSQREVLIRIAQLRKKDVIETKNRTLKCLKWQYCVINVKCCSVDGGRGICPLFSSPPPGICHPRHKNANARGLARRGGGEGWAGRSWN